MLALKILYSDTLYPCPSVQLRLDLSVCMNVQSKYFNFIFAKGYSSPGMYQYQKAEGFFLIEKSGCLARNMERITFLYLLLLLLYYWLRQTSYWQFAYPLYVQYVTCAMSMPYIRTYIWSMTSHCTVRESASLQKSNKIYFGLAVSEFRSLKFWLHLLVSILALLYPYNTYCTAFVEKWEKWPGPILLYSMLYCTVR